MPFQKKDGKSVRIVFNASRKGADAKSLNDLLLVGPKLTKNLAEILIQNRTKRYVIISDVKRLYPSILVEGTYDMYNLLWQEEEKIIAYRLRTLLTGSKDASFLATQTLKKHLNKIAETAPMLKETCEKLIESLHMDNSTLNEDDEESAV